jgi:hypothetical protein
MNYLTNYYKNLCEQLQEEIDLIQSKINYKKMFLEDNAIPATHGVDVEGPPSPDNDSPAISPEEPSDIYNKYKWDVNDAKKYKSSDEWLGAHPPPDRKNYQYEQDYERDLEQWIKARDIAWKYYTLHPSEEKKQLIRKDAFQRTKNWAKEPIERYIQNFGFKPIKPSEWDLKKLGQIWKISK